MNRNLAENQARKIETREEVLSFIKTLSISHIIDEDIMQEAITNHNICAERLSVKGLHGAGVWADRVWQFVENTLNLIDKQGARFELEL